jgi:hypothetical protein
MRIVLGVLEPDRGSGRWIARLGLTVRAGDRVERRRSADRARRADLRRRRTAPRPAAVNTAVRRAYSAASAAATRASIAPR